MKRKFFLHIILFLSAFLLLWFLLSQVNFRKTLRIEEGVNKLEKTLGSWSIKLFLEEYPKVESKEVESYVNNLLEKIKHPQSRWADETQLFILESEQVNAFALPNRKMIVFTGLLRFADKPEELAGVLAHELAHIQEDHVMEKLIKEMGVTALFTLISGEYSIRVIREVTRIISSTAYDRHLERKADELAVKYLMDAGIDPQPFLHLLTRLSDEHPDFPQELQWVSTHPHPENRVRYLQNLIEEKKEKGYQPLNKNEWSSVINQLREPS